MSLHVEVTGHGEPLVMLHGWGMHGGIWGETVAQLAREYEVHNVDLPGHGLSSKKQDFSSPFTLESVVDELSAKFAGPVNLCGWSLGGTIALRWAAREPHKIRRLVLVASTPCFANRGDWQFGMQSDTLQQFATELEDNFAATLRRFIALQVRGSEGERDLLSLLRKQLFSRGEPQLEALRGGLEILRNTDLRDLLPQIEHPILVIFGERDKLTPPEASYFLARTMKNARLLGIDGAAHAPFLSHSKIFIEHVRSFLHERF